MKIKVNFKEKFADKVCVKCGMQKACATLPGFCVLLPYAAIAGVVILLIYFIFNSQL